MTLHYYSLFQVNEDPKDTLMKKYQEEIEELRRMLEEEANEDSDDGDDDSDGHDDSDADDVVVGDGGINKGDLNTVDDHSHGRKSSCSKQIGQHSTNASAPPNRKVNHRKDCMNLLFYYYYSCRMRNIQQIVFYV